MHITEIKHGGVVMSFVHGEIGRLALLLDLAAYHVCESMGPNDSTSDAEDLSLLAATFTALEVACQCQAGYRASFARENTKPTFHLPD